ncbi:ABC transporter transmembrane domain-containing protein [Streptomyces chartreusis]
MSLRALPLADPGVPDTRSGFRFLLWLSRSQLRGQSVAAQWGIVYLGCVAAFPTVIGTAVQGVLDGSRGHLILAGVLIFALGMLSALADTMLHRAVINNWLSAATRVQQLLTGRILYLGALLSRQIAAGEAVAVSTSDVEKIGWFVEALARFVSNLIVVTGLTVALIVYEPVLGLTVMVGILVLVLVLIPLSRFATRRVDEQRARAGRAAELASDAVAGLRVLRGIGGEAQFLTRYRRASQHVRAAAVRSARVRALISAVQVALPGLMLLGIVWNGVRRAQAGEISAGELVAFFGTAVFLVLPLGGFQEIATKYSFARPSAARVVGVLSLARPTPISTGQRHPRLRGTLFDPVTGVRVQPGSFTAIVCSDYEMSGWLADRLGGYTPPGTPGEPSVSLGGVALDTVPLAVARTAILVQDKDPVLLSGTLADLLDVPTSGNVSVSEALEAAQCGDVLESLAQGSADDQADPLQTHITERGRSLSGGQRQRLALARSLVADPEVLILDEPTSAVDSYTEARIARAVRTLRAGRTTVVLSSSPLLLEEADQVAYLAAGSTAEFGTHRELLRRSSGYGLAVARDTAPVSPGAVAHTPDARKADEP